MPREPPLDDLYSALTHQNRRAILRYLTDVDAPVSLRVLTDELERRLNDDGTGTRDDRAIRVELVHAHLPKLAESGLVDWDGHTVAIAPDVKELSVSPPLVDGRFDFTVTRRESPP